MWDGDVQAVHKLETYASIPGHVWDTKNNRVVFVAGLHPTDTSFMLTKDKEKIEKIHLRRCTEEESPSLVADTKDDEDTKLPSWQPCRFAKPSTIHTFKSINNRHFETVYNTHLRKTSITDTFENVNDRHFETIHNRWC